MKKSIKIYFLITMFFLVSLLFCINTECFASTCVNDMPNSFTSFNGNDYIVGAYSNVIDVFSAKNVSHYIVLSEYTDGGSCPLFFVGFNESIEINYGEDGSLKIICDAGEFGYQVYYDGKSSVGDNGIKSIQEFTSNYSVVYCCDCMMQYQDEFSSDFFGRPLQVEQGILPPIIQVIPLKRVLKEIVEILPVILLIIVGLIGLRKALAFLQKVLYRS